MSNRKVYHVELDVVDDVEKFKEDAEYVEGVNEDVELMSEDTMLKYIKAAIGRFDKMDSLLSLNGVYITNVKVLVELDV